MLRVKRLYTFIYQTFLPVFAMTFGICLFIFIIQFLWQHIEKLVGKGLETSVLLELFFYAALNLIPMALPLAILLASLMTFGNMGERLELLAIKASGVSLLKIMKPMIVLIAAISIGCFFFQDKVSPKLRVKVTSLFYAIKQKSPELDIPEGAFYNELKQGYSIYVKEKDLNTHMLRDVIIYDSSDGGFKNMSVDVCDSALMTVADSKDYLTIKMFSGQRFANLKQSGGSASGSGTTEFVQYSRETFDTKEIIIPFNSDFDRIDESRYDDTQIAKDLNQLQTSIDSMQIKLDSLNVIDRKSVAKQGFVSHREQQAYKDSVAKVLDQKEPIVQPAYAKLDFDSVMNSYSQEKKLSILATASNESHTLSSNHLLYYHIDMPKPILQRNIRMHEIFWHQMFTLPFACLVFFFIGAPLGSIIRKGGLGVPVIISVILFIVYYIINNIGYKMARDGVWPVWQGIWFSSGILFPLGVFLTYKSMKESALFNVGVYGQYLRKALKVKSDNSRNMVKEPNPMDIPSLASLNVDSEQVNLFNEFDNKGLKDIVHNYKEYGYSREDMILALSLLKERGTYFFDVRVNNNDYSYSSRLLTYLDTNSLYFTIPLYICSLIMLILSQVLFKESTVISAVAIVCYSAYFVFYLKSVLYISDFYKSLNKKKSVWKVLMTYILCFVLYPVHYLLGLKKDMRRELELIKNVHF